MTTPNTEKSKGREKKADAAKTPKETAPARNFIQEIIDEDQKTGKFSGRVQTRFPPEPNGYLHIGHAKSICLNFGLAAEYGGKCNLRFDDTNPVKEDIEYINSIMEDVRWLGFKWDGLYYASDYFEQLYQWAEQLIKAGNAYVDSLTADEIREYRGTLTEPGRDSPYRSRSGRPEIGPADASFRDSRSESKRPPRGGRDRDRMVGDTGLEPVTSCMSSKCSNQLS